MSPRYGQHFLSNRHAAERIAAEVAPGPNDDVLEIGPGKGALTGLFLPARRLVAVEVDDEMAAGLRARYGHTRPNFELIHKDFLQFDLDSLTSPQPFKVVGNLPYNLTSPILRKLSEWTNWSSAVVMVQKEVGDRLSARVGTADYGALTVGMSVTCTVQHIFELSEKSFNPPPRVKSVVLRLRRRPEPLYDDVDRITRVIQAAFQQRRKTIENSFSHGLGFDKKAVTEALVHLNLDPRLRAERLTVEDYIRVTRRLLPSC